MSTIYPIWTKVQCLEWSNRNNPRLWIANRCGHKHLKGFNIHQIKIAESSQHAHSQWNFVVAFNRSSALIFLNHTPFKSCTLIFKILILYRTFLLLCAWIFPIVSSYRELDRFDPSLSRKMNSKLQAWVHDHTILHCSTGMPPAEQTNLERLKGVYNELLQKVRPSIYTHSKVLIYQEKDHQERSLEYEEKISRMQDELYSRLQEVKEYVDNESSFNI